MQGTDKDNSSGKRTPLAVLASTLIRHDTPRGYTKKLVQVLEVEAHDQSTISLGVYSDSQPPAGFVLAYRPEVEPLVMDSQIICVPRDQEHMQELRLICANYGTELIAVTVWELHQA